MDEDWDAEIASGVIYKPTVTAQPSSFAAPPPPPPSTSFKPFGRGRPFGGERDDRRSTYRDRNNNSNGEFGERFQSGGSGDDSITIESSQVSSLIGRGGATVSNIREKCQVRINIPSREEIGNERFVDVKIIGSEENVKRAKEMIRETLDDSRSRSRDNRDSSISGKRNFGGDRSWNDSDSFSNDRQAKKSHYAEPEPENSSSSSTVINWDLVRSQPLQNMSKFKDHPPVLKDFYVEDPEIASMTREEVDKFRKENYDISVSFFIKETLSYCSSVVKNDEEEAMKTKTAEELADLVHEQIPKPVKTIEQAFGLYPEIIAECKRQNFIKPTPIQAQIWPILLKGLDCIGIAQTGTGKTLGFLLPALVHTDKQLTPRDQRVGPNVLVLSPTRELAIQIEQEVKKINYKGMKSVVVYGGGDRKEQVNVCTQGVEIVIATPGRLYDLIQAGVINVTSVTFLVLDEADRMLDMGFEPQIMKILLDIRPDRQTVMTSATWPEGVRRLAIKYLVKPVQLYVGSLDLRAAKTVKQNCVLVRADDEKKEHLLRYIEREMTDEDKLLVFVGRKATADNLSCDLIMRNIQCQSIHGDREQCDREEALADFKESRVRILIATDVASRGIDVKDITRVINFDFPRNIEEYVHRVGRTGRAGRTGEAFTYVAREDWKHAKELIEILRQGEQEVPHGLVEMAERYEAMQKKKMEENAMMGGGFGRSGGGGRGGGGDGCFNCGEPGHFSRECPKKGGRAGGGFSGRSEGYGGRGRRQPSDRFF